MRVAGRPLPVVLIALEKGLSTLGLLAGAAFAFVLRGHPGRHPVEVAFARALAADSHHALLQWLIRHVPYVSPDQALAWGIGLLCWAALFAAQTIGVWIQAAWGEVLVIVETSAFLPLEAWNIVRHHRPLEFVTTPINLLILAYLVRAYARRRRAGHTGRAPIAIGSR